MVKKTIDSFEKRGVVWSKEIRAEASRLASIANKRIQRLEKAGLESSPAYQKWIDEGGQKFSVRGKTINEVQSELARLRRFIDAKTSTIRGVNATLKEMASNTGMTYKSIAELRGKADNFFTLASKVEQYLRTVEDIASAIGYQKIWEAINVYVKDAEIDLGDSNIDLDQMTQLVSSVITKHDSNKLEEFEAKGGGIIWGVVK